MRVEGSGRGPFGRYYPGIRMEPLRRTTAELRKASGLAEVRNGHLPNTSPDVLLSQSLFQAYKFLPEAFFLHSAS
jgi:hypothetical protein